VIGVPLGCGIDPALMQAKARAALALSRRAHPLRRIWSAGFAGPTGASFAFWCVPTKLLKGSSAAAGIALVSSIGTSGGFFGPSIIGFLKQTTGGDSGAFLGLAGLAFLGALICIGLRQTAAFSPNRRVIGVAPTSQNA